MVRTRETAIQVNSLLTAYIAIHNDIFSASIRRFIPIPGLHKKIEFCQHRVSLAQISARLQECEAEVATARSEGGTESQFASALMQYSRALNTAVMHLQRMTDLLCRKAQGEPGYSMEIYNRDCDRYNQLVQHYTELGESLNEFVRGW